MFSYEPTALVGGQSYAPTYQTDPLRISLSDLTLVRRFYDARFRAGLCRENLAFGVRAPPGKTHRRRLRLPGRGRAGAAAARRAQRVDRHGRRWLHKMS
jgi:hypothetical protein